MNALLLILAADLAGVPAQMQAFVDRGVIAGTVTLVRHRGQPVHLAATGWQDREKKVPMQTSSIFQIMSMTKPITSVAIAMLVEEGKLTFTDRVDRHLPEFAGRPITVRELLTHTSGMPEYGPEATRDLYRSFRWTLEQAVLLFSQQPALAPPGERFQYSNPGMATLGRLVEVASGLPYERFLEERIFRPLGMQDTHVFLPAAKRSRLAMTYVAGPKGTLEPAGDLIYRDGARYPMPEGGLYSTAEDYAKFLEAMRTGGAPLISRAMAQVMTMNHLGGIKGYWGPWGLGFRVDPAVEGFGHGGALGTDSWAERRTGIVRVLMMQKYGQSVEEIRNAFAKSVTAALGN